LIELAQARVHGTAAGHAAAVRAVEPGKRAVVPIDELRAQYYMLLRVADQPGVLAAVALVFTHHQVSIKSVWQEGRGDEAQLVVITHRAQERALQACVRDLALVETVHEVSSVIRVEAEEP